MAISNIRTASNGDGISCSLEIADSSGNNRKAIAIVTQERSTLTVTAPTLNGVTGTPVISFDETGTSNPLRILVYEWNDSGTNGIASLPSSSGTYTVATTGTVAEIAVHAFSCSGAAQTACVDPKTVSNTANTQDDPSFTLTAATGSLAMMALVDVSAVITITTGTSQTDILAPTSSGNAQHASSYKTENLTVSYTRSGGASSQYAAAAWALEPAASGGLTITSVTPTSFDSGVTGIVIAGSGFGATQGSSTLTIGSQAQTVTSWSDTSITFTSARGSNSMGAASLKLTKG